MIGTDSHTPNAGGLGMFACGVGGADAVDVMAGFPWEVLYPQQGRRAPHGPALRLGVAEGRDPQGLRRADGEGRHQPRRRVLRPRRRVDQLHRQGHDHQHGRRARRDDVDLSLRRAHGDLPRRRPSAASSRISPTRTPSCSGRTRRCSTDPDRYFDEIVEIDLSNLEPHIVGPHTPDLARPSRRWPPTRRRTAIPLTLTSALIGSCTNSSYEDMSRAADVARQAAAARRQGEVDAVGDAGLGAGPPDDRARRADGGSRGDRRAPCSRTPAGRASASGSATTSKTGERELDHQLLQPQLPEAQRRQPRDALVHRQPRDPRRLRAGRHARLRTRSTAN